MEQATTVKAIKPADLEKKSYTLAADQPALRHETIDEGSDCVSDEQKIIAQEAIDEALVLLDQSRASWEHGELDDALNILDQAYALTFDINDDPEITWQKDDLRFLIAKRIVEIYASRSTVAVGKQSEIPLSTADEVDQEIRRFQNQERTFFLESYRRSGAYRDMMVQHLREAGLPEELSWLPLVESGFKVKAFSSARALGLWQFIPSTGYKFGLQRDQFLDERMDPEKATHAAIAYLTELHGIFGDWHTALAAYNCGEGRVLRVISRQQLNYLDNFWDLYQELPRETRRYVPRFLATVRIINDPEKYGFDLENEILDDPVSYEIVVTEKSIRLADIAQHLGMTERELELLNAELRLKVTPDRIYEFKVPSGKAETLRAALNEIPESPVMTAQTGSTVRHQVRRGETLSAIAHRYNSSVSAITQANNISQRHMIRVGQVLRVPVSGSRQIAATSPPTSPQSHRVQRGETLSAIALRYGSSIDAISRANNMSRNQIIRVGQVLTIPAGAGATVPASGDTRLISYTVKKGDSLFHLARRYNTTVTEITRVNNISGNMIRVGQELRIPTSVTQTQGVAASSSGGEKITYVVQGGDSPYTIARRFNVGLDNLLNANGLSRNCRIYPGQELTVKQ